MIDSCGQTKCATIDSNTSSSRRNAKSRRSCTSGRQSESLIFNSVASSGCRNSKAISLICRGRWNIRCKSYTTRCVIESTCAPCIGDIGRCRALPSNGRFLLDRCSQSNITTSNASVGPIICCCNITSSSDNNFIVGIISTGTTRQGRRHQRTNHCHHQKQGQQFASHVFHNLFLSFLSHGAPPQIWICCKGYSIKSM